MGTVWVREFTGGLDSRRYPETTPGGVLIRAENAHITRGGQFQKRAAFKLAYTVPSNTVGLARDNDSLVVFGAAAEGSVSPPAGVRYEQLAFEGGADVASIPSFDLFGGKLYVAARAVGGDIDHFYDGQRVLAWADGKAGASFSITNGKFITAAYAVGKFSVSNTNNGSTVSAAMIDGVSLIAGTVTVSSNNSALSASEIAAAIAAYSATSKYTATASGIEVTVTATVATDAANGKPIVLTVAGMTIGAQVAMAGGVTPGASQITDIKIAGVSILDGPILWTGDAPTMATAVANAINAKATSPEYTAAATAATVSITADAVGTAANGLVVVLTTANELTYTPTTVTMDGGTGGELYQPGQFVRTIGSKVYALSGPILFFSGIKAPTQYTSAAIGAGFIDMSTETSGSELLTAVARYQNYIAVFAEEVIQIWYVDPDPSLNKQSQVLNNTGTRSPQSVTQFGDNDIFYLDQSGLRSLRARDSSNSAATTDIGVLIDDIIGPKLRAMTDDEALRIYGLIEPREGRFWLVMRDQIFVFSYYNGAKVSAWTVYNCTDEAGNPFIVDYATVFNRKVYLRSGNKIYVYGGLGEELEYDASVAVAQVPYFDVDKPTKKKSWTGFDAVARGMWDVYFGFAPNDLTVLDKVAAVYDTTYDDDRIPVNGESTHVTVQLRSTNDGYAELGALVIHYGGDDDED